VCLKKLEQVQEICTTPNISCGKTSIINAVEDYAKRWAKRENKEQDTKCQNGLKV
jgi:hypothetical protein